MTARAAPALPASMLNQLARYEPVVALIEEVPGSTLLEVGSGSAGAARFTSDRWNVTLADLDFTDYGSIDEAGASDAERVVADVLELPFPDRAFDVVVAVDLLEHVAGPDRKRALGELARVAKHRAIVAAPTGEAALRADRRLARFYERFGRSVPPWLVEHLENGFPDAEEIGAGLRPYGRVTLAPNEWAAAHGLVARMEATPVLLRTTLIASRLLEPAARAQGSTLGKSLIRVVRGFDRSPRYRTIAVLDREPD